MKINESYKPLLKNWLYGIAFYFIPFVIGYLAFRSILSDNLLHADVDSARYMLSALVQSEAAIVALVVTLSLVAVQLAAQSYSARVIEVFRRTPDLWILMGIYGVAIFYGLGVLKMIENPLVGRLSNLEGQVAFSYYLGVFAFVALVPYIWKTLDLLKPSTVIKVLSEEITKGNILYSLEERQDSSIQPIIDIVRGSLDKYDYETVREGLKTIGERTNIIFVNEIANRDEEEKISKHIFPHLTRLGKLAASKNDEDSTLEVIYNLHKNGITAIEHRLQSATLQIELSLEEIGKVAAEYKLEDATRRVVISLGNIGKVSAEYKLENAASWAAQFLGLVGQSAAEQKLKDVTLLALEYLKEIGKVVATSKHEYELTKVVEVLEKIGMTAGKQGLDYVIIRASKALVEVGKAAYEQKFEDDVVTQKVVDALNEFIKISDEQKFDWAKKETEDCLKNYLKKINET